MVLGAGLTFEHVFARPNIIIIIRHRPLTVQRLYTCEPDVTVFPVYIAWNHVRLATVNLLFQIVELYM